jgi:FMN reductase
MSRQLIARGCSVDLLDFLKEPLPHFNPDTAYDAPGYSALKRRVDQADILLLGTPDYHGSMSSVIKTFLDHFWREFAGKLFATLVASHDKGLTVTNATHGRFPTPFRSSKGRTFKTAKSSTPRCGSAWK